MASRRCLRALTQTRPFLFRKASSLRSLAVLPFPNSNASPHAFTARASVFAQCPHLRCFSSDKKDDHSDEEDDSDEDYDEEEDYVDDDDVTVSRGKKVYTAEEKEAEAAAIGYRVVGPLQKEEDSVFKPYEPVFAVVQIGSHQFKVSNRDSIFTERLKFCEVNDKVSISFARRS
ncbi:50S ribosomal protein L21, mitochondrial isoform B [Glycine soja]|uniref:Large ribosomal subunit protein bL21m n=1 Tax=Glycine soja TaxID=3848 RepID=A0A445JYY6_GLYSO|nr:50S ribosomal protein L21, mitochondrial isoform B [Glycine soja]